MYQLRERERERERERRERERERERERSLSFPFLSSYFLFFLSFAATVPEHPLWSMSFFCSSSCMSMFGSAIFKMFPFSALRVLFCSYNISIILCML